MLVHRSNYCSVNKYLVVKTVDAKLALLQFILVEVGPPPDLGVYDVRESLSARNLKGGKVKARDKSFP